MTNEDIKKEDVINDDDIDTSEENQDMADETEVNDVSDDEKYQDLIVRVAGYSDHFNNLSRALQDEIIGRTEQTF